ncbi:MAG: intracellular proteinase inhibitor Ipi, partial [Selenomonas sp.]|nr:intracellular proteinase inhibitor Ipi [Selenomonas sp.]
MKIIGLTEGIPMKPTKLFAALLTAALLAPALAPAAEAGIGG